MLQSVDVAIMLQPAFPEMIQAGVQLPAQFAQALLHRLHTLLQRSQTLLHRLHTLLQRSQTLLHRLHTLLQRSQTILHRPQTLLHSGDALCQVSNLVPESIQDSLLLLKPTKNCTHQLFCLFLVQRALPPRFNLNLKEDSW